MPSRSVSSVPPPRLLYQLSHAQAGGTIRVARPDGATAPLSVEMERGWVHAIELSPAYAKVGAAPERGEDRLRILLEISTQEYSAWSHDPKAARRQHGACRPFHPAATLRSHLESLGGDDALWRARVGGGRVSVTQAPHPSALGAGERPLVSFLAHGRTLAELDRAKLCPPERMQRLMAFLDAMGALAISHEPGPSPYALLEVPEGAAQDEVKRAYRRLARELHPDRHPAASAEDLRDLERRFAEVSAAYRRLV